MKKLFLTVLLFLTLVVAQTAPVFAAGKADGQSCHDGSECASNNCVASGGGRVCRPVGWSPESPDSLEVTSETLDTFDPLLIGESAEAAALSTPAGIINQVLRFAFPLAGMILFVMIVVGGFQMVMGAGEQKSLESGRQRVTMAILGFILLFSSYWIAQILESLLNIKIL